jgi:hypothetical protein
MREPEPVSVPNKPSKKQERKTIQIDVPPLPKELRFDLPDDAEPPTEK